MDKVLIYDIETKTEGLPNPEVDRLKFFGCYSFMTGKYYILTDMEKIQKVIDAHKFIVGFNNKKYDDIVLKREGIKIDYKINIDLYDVLKPGIGTKGRALIIKIKEGELKDLLETYSLDFICKTLHLMEDNEGKLDFDYSLLQKNVWTKEELASIYAYLKRDLELTKRLWEWLENYFGYFKDFLKPEDVEKKVYINSSPAKLGYKAICNALGWEETYGQFFDENEEKISGGYVAFPAGEYFEDGYVFDFASEYPHAMMMCNLYGRVEQDETAWNGGNVWKIVGKYDKHQLAQIGELIKLWFKERAERKKKGDKSEYTYKILLNLMYGIMDHPYYIRTYDKIAAQDCTNIGKQWILYGRKKFREAGYKIIYSDTDSIFIHDPTKDKERILKVKKEIIDFIKSTVPFPQDTFDMKLEDEIKYFYFFKGEPTDKNEEYYDEDDIKNKPLCLMSKNYILVTQDKRLIIKNLGIRKKSNSKLSKKIFWENMVPKIKEGQIKFAKTQVTNWIMELLQKDIKLTLMRKEVGDLSQYSKSPTGIQAQLSKRYGAGIHFVLPNTKFGCGLGKTKYCTLEDFYSQKLRLEDIDKEMFYNELNYFIKDPITKNIFEF